MKKQRAVILIIAHKSDPSDLEIASLRQCWKILGKHRIVLVCPSGLNVERYKHFGQGIEFDFIDAKWHSSYAMFNRLKIDPFLYRRYAKYDFIMFYELDAWVFKDELEYWCDQDFDFIGAPWFEAYDGATENATFLGVGNGGFSLRKTRSHLRALNTFCFIRSPKIILRELSDNFSLKALGSALSSLTFRNNTFFLLNDYRFNEDHFWGRIVAKKFSWFRVPDLETASKFAFELNAPYLYRLNDNTLPFGCHKWSKYEPDFWRPFIGMEGGTSKLLEIRQ